MRLSVKSCCLFPGRAKKLCSRRRHGLTCAIKPKWPALFLWKSRRFPWPALSPHNWRHQIKSASRAVGCGENRWILDSLHMSHRKLHKWRSVFALHFHYFVSHLQRSPLFRANIVKKDPDGARQNSLATAGTNFTKPGAQNKVDPCTWNNECFLRPPGVYSPTHLLTSILHTLVPDQLDMRSWMKTKLIYNTVEGSEPIFHLKT